MGTYMSAYVEVDGSKTSAPFTDPHLVHSLTDGSFNFGKDYEVFDALAGGRNCRMPRDDQRLESDRSFLRAVSLHHVALRLDGTIFYSLLIPRTCRIPTSGRRSGWFLRQSPTSPFAILAVANRDSFSGSIPNEAINGGASSPNLLTTTRPGSFLKNSRSRSGTTELTWMHSPPFIA
jgi:hypothetical protein